ncbi:protein kinase [Nocardia sp. NPDC020380]|uniref:serine/threonine-protein kinase n=1 Tax=Nocardia sp. NPDC020380 TaxID=3364309 RepID=UPI003788BB9D
MLKNGDVFAGFTIERLLGQGGMGSVYLARHPRLGRLTALKLLNRELYADREIRARFEREADLVAQLDHPNIVEVYDRGSEDEQLWISMQYVDGVDAAGVNVRTLPPERAVQIIEGVAAALDYAHSMGVLHRDVKPANIILARAVAGHGERVFLTDFGIARLREDSTHLTQAGMFTATLAYASPEQMTGAHLDPGTDQYSLALSLYWLLIGAGPFDSPDPSAIIHGHLQLLPPPVSLRRPGLTPAMDAVLTKAMAKRAPDRFPSCAAFAKAARQALTAPTTPHPVYPTPQALQPYPPAYPPQPAYPQAYQPPPGYQGPQQPYPATYPAPPAGYPAPQQQSPQPAGAPAPAYPAYPAPAHPAPQQQPPPQPAGPPQPASHAAGAPQPASHTAGAPQHQSASPAHSISGDAASQQHPSPRPQQLSAPSPASGPEFVAHDEPTPADRAGYVAASNSPDQRTDLLTQPGVPQQHPADRSAPANAQPFDAAPEESSEERSDAPQPGNSTSAAAGESAIAEGGASSGASGQLGASGPPPSAQAGSPRPGGLAGGVPAAAGPVTAAAIALQSAGSLAGGTISATGAGPKSAAATADSESVGASATDDAEAVSREPEGPARAVSQDEIVTAVSAPVVRPAPEQVPAGYPGAELRHPESGAFVPASGEAGGVSGRGERDPGVSEGYSAGPATSGGLPVISVGQGESGFGAPPAVSPGAPYGAAPGSFGPNHVPPQRVPGQGRSSQVAAMVMVGFTAVVLVLLVVIVLVLVAR